MASGLPSTSLDSAPDCAASVTGAYYGIVLRGTKHPKTSDDPAKSKVWVGIFERLVI